MTFFERSGGNRRRLLRTTHSFGLALAVLIWVGSTVLSQTQIPKSALHPPDKAEPRPPVDPLGRESPRSAILGFLKCIDREDYDNAARYLQPTPGLDLSWILQAKESREVPRRFKGDIALLSDDPEGTVEPGLPPGRVRAGVLTAGSLTVDVILARVDDPTSGKIWLISKETVAGIPELYAEIESEPPRAFSRQRSILSKRSRKTPYTLGPMPASRIPTH